MSHETRTNQLIMTSLSQPGMDVQNITPIVSGLADVDQVRESKLTAMRDMIYDMQCAPDAVFYMKHKGVIVEIGNVCLNGEERWHQEAGFYLFGEGEWICSVRVTPHQAYSSWFMGELDELTKDILNRMDDENYCPLCGILGTMTGKPMCRFCALTELKGGYCWRQGPFRLGRLQSTLVFSRPNTPGRV